MSSFISWKNVFNTTDSMEIFSQKLKRTINRTNYQYFIHNKQVYDINGYCIKVSVKQLDEGGVTVFNKANRLKNLYEKQDEGAIIQFRTHKESKVWHTVSNKKKEGTKYTFSPFIEYRVRPARTKEEKYNDFFTKFKNQIQSYDDNFYYLTEQDILTIYENGWKDKGERY
jgi:hypothetical protein